jgi:hypothetical protein
MMLCTGKLVLCSSNTEPVAFRTQLAWALLGQGPLRHFH